MLGDLHSGPELLGTEHEVALVIVVALTTWGNLKIIVWLLAWTQLETLQPTVLAHWYCDP